VTCFSVEMVYRYIDVSRNFQRWAVNKRLTFEVKKGILMCGTWDMGQYRP
jgi:hypothetical protein